MGIKTLLAIGLGGFIGAVLRVYFIGWVHKITSWPMMGMGTLGVNLLGSMLIGMLFAFFTFTHFDSPHLKSFLQTGILGAFTTYSTFALEAFVMLTNHQYAHFALYFTGNAVGSVIAVFAGYWLVKLFF